MNVEVVEKGVGESSNNQEGHKLQQGKREQSQLRSHWAIWGGGRTRETPKDAENIF